MIRQMTQSNKPKAAMPAPYLAHLPEDGLGGLRINEKNLEILEQRTMILITFLQQV